jgi:hypothetical protein
MLELGPSDISIYNWSYIRESRFLGLVFLCSWIVPPDLLCSSVSSEGPWGQPLSLFLVS